jgi:hypothetical protein
VPPPSLEATARPAAPAPPSSRSTEAAVTEKNFDKGAPESYSVRITFENGDVSDSAVVRCGPFGWSSYIASLSYAPDIATSSDKTVNFDSISEVDFLDMTPEEAEEVKTTKHWVKKIRLTFKDGAIRDNVYLRSHCYYSTPYENACLNETVPRPRKLIIRRRDV